MRIPLSPHRSRATYDHHLGQSILLGAKVTRRKDQVPAQILATGSALLPVSFLDSRIGADTVASIGTPQISTYIRTQSSNGCLRLLLYAFTHAHKCHLSSAHGHLVDTTAYRHWFSSALACLSPAGRKAFHPSPFILSSLLPCPLNTLSIPSTRRSTPRLSRQIVKGNLGATVPFPQLF